jgi:hypothetical protein
MPRARAASSGPGMAGWPARRCRARSPSWLFLRWRAMGTRDPSNPLHLFRRPAAAPRLLLLPASQRREGRRILGAKVRDEALPGHPILPPEAEPRSPPPRRRGTGALSAGYLLPGRGGAPLPPHAGPGAPVSFCSPSALRPKLTPPPTGLPASPPSLSLPCSAICIRGERDCNFASPLSSKAICLRHLPHLLEALPCLNSSKWRGNNAFAFSVEVSLREWFFGR